MVEKILEPAWPTCAMHSSTVLMLYLSGMDFSFNLLKSKTTRRPWPSFFLTQKMGELNLDVDRRLNDP